MTAAVPLRIDLNCDMGESFGQYVLGRDEEIMPLVSSANVACGFHAGDPGVMYRTLSLALRHDVAVGAHPGYRDLHGFGRRELDCTEDDLYGDVLYQVGAISAFCRALGLDLHHVKPHGALYNAAHRNAAVARAVCRAVRAFDPDLAVYAMPGGHLHQVAEAMGLKVALEAFADRAYNRDGSLASRRLPGAVLHDPEAVAGQVLRLVQAGKVTALDGADLDLAPQTICIHGDNPQALDLVRAVRARLAAAGVEVCPPYLSHEGDAMIG